MRNVGSDALQDQVHALNQSVRSLPDVEAVPLVNKVLADMKAQKRTRCRHSDEKFTVVAYRMLNRLNDVTYLRIDIYHRADTTKPSLRESNYQDD